jgi:hypothetical protein
VLSNEILSQCTADYQNWEATFARNHRIPIEWAEKGVRKEHHVLPWQRRRVWTDSLASTAFSRAWNLVRIPKLLTAAA